MPIVSAPCARATCTRVRSVLVDPGRDAPPGFCRECQRVLPRPRPKVKRETLAVRFERSASGAWGSVCPDEPRAECEALSLADCADEFARRLRAVCSGRADSETPAHEVGGPDGT